MWLKLTFFKLPKITFLVNGSSKVGPLQCNNIKIDFYSEPSGLLAYIFKKHFSSLNYLTERH